MHLQTACVASITYAFSFPNRPCSTNQMARLPLASANQISAVSSFNIV